MEHLFSSKETRDGYPSFPMELMDVPSVEVDVQDMNNLDNLADQRLPFFVSSPLATFSEIFSPFDESNFTNSYSGISTVNGDRDKFVSDDDGASMIMMIPRSHLHSLTEKMLKAMHLLKELCGKDLLAQIWVPTRNGNEYILTTCDQPYLLDQNLLGYREVSTSFVFSAESETGPFSGLPGRVFVSKIPEWTSRVMYYNKAEYLRLQYALEHKVQGSIALPVFEDDSLEASCCAVLELVTLKEKPNFDLEMENVCRALEAVTLRSNIPSRLCPQTLSKNQRAALVEVKDVLRVVCRAHQLPLALTWIPCNYPEGVGEETIKMRARGYNNTSPNEKCVLCIEDTACYVKDQDMQSFMHACAGHYLEEGQGIVGKALQSNHPIFNPGVKGYHVSEYPLVHHARKFGLSAATAIRLRSSYTCDDDYILEFFLPVNMKESTEQQVLFGNILISMQKLYTSLRTAEFLRVEDSKDEVKSVPAIELSQRSCEESLIDKDSTYFRHSTENASELITDCYYQQPIAGSTRQTEKKRSTSEKRVSLSVIQQHFSRNLSDAAKNIGVCPTTLKKICRKYGITRWTSRKMNKANRSLSKVQSMFDFVEGVNVELQYNVTTGDFMAASSITQEKSAPVSSFMDTETTIVKNKEKCLVDGCKVIGANWTTSTKAPKSSFLTTEGCHGWIPSISSNLTIVVDIETKRKDDDFVEYNQPTSSRMTGSSNEFGSRSVSMSNDSSLSLRSIGERQNPEIKSGSGSKIIVKATYKRDIFRFKFDYYVGCMQLYKEVAKKLKLQVRQFQLKYVDNEDEWVILVSDSDLLKCIELLNFMGKQSMKLTVRDMPCIMGSLSGTNNFLGGVSPCHAKV